MMIRNPLIWIGLGGVPREDNARAHAWQHRLHWIMVGVALLSLPAYLLDTAGATEFSHQLATLLDVLILVAFSLELLLMMTVSSHPVRYVVENWLNVIIIAGSAAAVFGAATEWIALVRIMRVAIGGLVMVRTFTEFHILFTRRGAPMLMGVTFITLLVVAMLFYWLDPRIDSFWDGLWLAFITGATVGYGDLVPTTGPTRVVAAFMVVAGVALMTLFTANVVSFFLGNGDSLTRTELHREVTELRNELRELLHGRRDDPRETSVTAALHEDVARLREEIALLRAELARRDERSRDPGPD